MNRKTEEIRDLHSQVAIVTGGGRGIGRSTAQMLAEAGAKVAVIARTEDQLEETAALIRSAGGNVSVFPADVTDEQRIKHVTAEVERLLGPITLLINNAGSGKAAGPIWSGDADEWWRDVEVNLRGPYLCSRAVLPGMIARREGRIINIASNAGIRPVPYASAYSCSKAALLRFTDTLAESVEALGIRVFAISPGWVWTEMTEHAFKIMKEAMPDFQGIPDNEVYQPEVAAKLVVRLASGEADTLSGRYIHVNDDLDGLISDVKRIQEEDLYTLRLNV
jgi:NAD(P)-dependent dehydrogenase (short-subunit alcohol dehydrogenase family)